MKIRMFIMLLLVTLLFGAIFGFQIFKSKMIKKILSQGTPPVSVATMRVSAQLWHPKIKAVGSIRAVQGVDVSSEVPGVIRSIHFIPGSQIEEKTPLITLNDDTEQAQLRALEVAQEIAETTFKRDREQLKVHAVSQQTLDNDMATLKGAIAQVALQKALIAKKQILAPFAGQLGIAKINLGQFINAGEKIVTLQALDPLYIDFSIPQQDLPKVNIGQPITVHTDTFPRQIFHGKIKTINPKVDPSTRNVQIEGIITNPKHELLPGMFANIEVTTGKAQPFLTLPQTAISFNPYGEIVYVIKEQGKNPQGKPHYIASQTFVTTGERRGDQVAVLKGLQEEETVVVSGQLKLKNGDAVIINNSILPSNQPNPVVVDQ